MKRTCGYCGEVLPHKWAGVDHTGLGFVCDYRLPTQHYHPTIEDADRHRKEGAAFIPTPPRIRSAPHKAGARTPAPTVPADGQAQDPVS